MALEKTKEKLTLLRNKYSEDLGYAKKDIKPNDSGISGYSYSGIEDRDRDFIYGAIASLKETISNSYTGIAFDIEKFISEKKALAELKKDFEFIKEDYIKLLSLKPKYGDENNLFYPLAECIRYHQEIHDILEEILNSEEIREFESPGESENLRNENLNYKFKEYWRKKQWNYIIHLILFLPFIAMVCWLVIQRENKNLSNGSMLPIVIGIALITIVFNLVFNNHNSFKDSWKLILPNARHNFIQKQREEYINKHKLGK